MGVGGTGTWLGFVLAIAVTLLSTGCGSGGGSGGASNPGTVPIAVPATTGTLQVTIDESAFQAAIAGQRTRFAALVPPSTVRFRVHVKSATTGEDVVPPVDVTR